MVLGDSSQSTVAVVLGVSISRMGILVTKNVLSGLEMSP